VRDEGSSQVALAARRFSENFTPLSRAVPAHDAVLLSAPPDHAVGIPWVVRFGSKSPVALCGSPA
jgi:hypothetical protein